MLMFWNPIYDKESQSLKIGIVDKFEDYDDSLLSGLTTGCSCPPHGLCWLSVSSTTMWSGLLVLSSWRTGPRTTSRTSWSSTISSRHSSVSGYSWRPAVSGYQGNITGCVSLWTILTLRMGGWLLIWFGGISSQNSSTTSTPSSSSSARSFPTFPPFMWFIMVSCPSQLGGVSGNIFHNNLIFLPIWFFN